MRPNLITRLKEEWNNLDPVDPLRGLISDAIDALAEQPAQQPEQEPLTDRELFKQALEALENPNDIDEYNRSKDDLAITALRERLAQPAQQPPFLEPDYYVYNIDGQYRLADPQPTIKWGKK